MGIKSKVLVRTPRNEDRQKKTVQGVSHRAGKRKKTKSRRVRKDRAGRSYRRG